MRIKFASVKYFQGQEGRLCVPAICSTSADSACTAVQPTLLPQSTLQPQAVKSLRGIWRHPALSLLLHLLLQSLCKQSYNPRPYLIPEINYNLGNTVMKINQTGGRKERLWLVLPPSIAFVWLNIHWDTQQGKEKAGSFGNGNRLSTHQQQLGPLQLFTPKLQV